MARVGQFVTNPKAGAYCRMTLDKGEKIVINHDKGGFEDGWLLIEQLRVPGLSSERIFSCNLDSDEGKAALGYLIRDAEPRGLDATPLGAFVRYLKTCRSVDEIKARCAALMALHPPTVG